MAGITVLGSVGVDDGGPELTRRDRVVLAALVVARDRELPAATLADALWGETLPASWTKIVQGCVWRLRRRLGPEAILTGAHGYRLALGRRHIDADVFVESVDKAQHLLQIGHHDQAAFAADRALALWRAPPLPDLEEWDPGRAEAERLTQLHLLAEDIRLEARIVGGRQREVLAEAELRVREQPLREGRWALLARALYQEDRQAEALDTIRQARAVLTDELGLDLGRELQRLEGSILRQDRALAVTSPGPTSPVCPWPGLAAYDVDDSEVFFGRDTELAECLERLEATGFLAVVGPSGSGKSSLARAGVAARLSHDGAAVQVITPGSTPVAALAAVGPSGILVVDQLEEAFDRTVGDGDRARFVTALVERALTTPVVVTLRADRLGELAAHATLSRLVQEGLYLLSALDVAALRETVELPARQAGLLLEDGLGELIDRDVRGEPGSLPLLAHALRETWRRREGATLTVEGYRAAGGIRGAVAQSAEAIYQGATEAQRLVLRELLLRMVRPGPGGDPVRTSVPRDVVGLDADEADLLERLVQARLVVAGEDRVEIAHEALARAWPRLRTWLAEDMEGENIRHHLTTSAEAWAAMGRPDSELYRGARLAAATEWAGGGTHRLTPEAEAFLVASQAAHRSRLSRAEHEARRQRRLNRRLRALVLGVAGLALVALVFGAVAGVQWRESQAARGTATAEAARARAHEIAASALAAIDDNPALARSLAVVAARSAAPSLQVTAALHRAHAADAVVSRVSMNHFAQRLVAVLHPDGSRVALTGESALEPALALEVHDALSGDLLWEWVRPEEPGHESAFVAGAVYSDDGSVLAGGIVWQTDHYLRIGPALPFSPPPADRLLGVHLWDARTHEELEVLDIGPCGGWPVHLSGRTVLVQTLEPPPGAGPSQRDRLLEECLWEEAMLGTYAIDLDDGTRRRLGRTRLGPSGPLDAPGAVAALSGDGRVAAAWDDRLGATVVVDVRTGTTLVRLPSLLPHDLDATGARLLVSERSGTGTRWRVLSTRDGRVLTTLGGSGPAVHGSFGTDASTVLTAGADNVLNHWDAMTGERLGRIPATGSGRPSVARDRWVLVPRPTTYGAVLADLHPRGERWSVASCGGPGRTDQLRAAGGHVLVGRDCGRQGQTETYTADGELVRRLPAQALTPAIDLSPDGRRVVGQAGRAGPAGDGDAVVGPLEIRDAVTGVRVATLEGFCEHPLGDPSPRGCARPPQTPFTFEAWRVRWSPDGRLVAAVDDDGTAVLVWDPTDGRLVTALATPGSPVAERWGDPFELMFAPGSDRLVVTTRAGAVVSWDTRAWQSVAGPLPVQNASFAAPVGYAENGDLVLVSPYRLDVASTVVMLVDPETLALRNAWTNVIEGSVRSAAVSPDRTRLALAADEGFVAVWDLGTGAIVDHIDPGLGPVQGVHWLGPQELVLLGAAGDLVTVTTDPARLLEVVGSALNRGLTPVDCAGYRISPCPHLADLLGSAPTVPPELRATWAVSWTEQELYTALVERSTTAYGGVTGGNLVEFENVSRDLAGIYRLTFTATSYTLDKDGTTWCHGSVTTTARRPGRLLLGAEGGDRCLDFHLAEVGFRRDGDELSLPLETFRGGYLDQTLLALRPLQLVD